MKCPKCNADLKASDLGEYGFVILDICPGCQGAWFDKGELDRLDDSVWQDAEELAFSDVSDSHQGLKCPKCTAQLRPLVPMDDKELVLDRCPNCQGFWLDSGELERVRALTLKLDSDLVSKAKPLKRPDNWSWLRWSVYCFKEYYFPSRSS